MKEGGMVGPTIRGRRNEDKKVVPPEPRSRARHSSPAMI
jgi:hypothetical protein